MSEDEAKGKWCPFSRVGSLGAMGSGWNRPEMESFGHREKIGGESHCIGSACMAWRWRFEQTNKSPYGQASWPMAEPIYRQTEQGFCGLAGSQ